MRKNLTIAGQSYRRAWKVGKVCRVLDIRTVDGVAGDGTYGRQLLQESPGDGDALARLAVR